MLMLILIGSIVGTLLGLRYKVLVFIPVIVVAMAIVAFGGTAGDGGFLQLAFTMFAVVISLQLGYLLGNVAVAAIEAFGRTRICRAGSRPKSAG